MIYPHQPWTPCRCPNPEYSFRSPTMRPCRLAYSSLTQAFPMPINNESISKTTNQVDAYHLLLESRRKEGHLRSSRLSLFRPRHGPNMPCRAYEIQPPSNLTQDRIFILNRSPAYCYLPSIDSVDPDLIPLNLEHGRCRGRFLAMRLGAFILYTVAIPSRK